MFFFNDSATTEIYPYWHSLSLHDALPISSIRCSSVQLSDVSITGQARDRTRRASPFNSRMLSRMGETDRPEADQPEAKRSSLMHIGILTGGGDVPGLNACIRSDRKSTRLNSSH